MESKIITKNVYKSLEKEGKTRSENMGKEGKRIISNGTKSEKYFQDQNFKKKNIKSSGDDTEKTLLKNHKKY